jgi:subtilisin-like proprotein convertase family protein
LIAAVICISSAALGAASANAATFSNPGSITINDAAPATPYPSNIGVAGLGTGVVHVSATLSGFSHTFPADVDILLVGPQGQNVMLMSDVPRDDPFCGNAVTGLALTFDDAAAGPIPPNVTLASGTYQPTNNDTFFPACAPVGGDTDSFSAPAPGAPYGSKMSLFNGTNPNGAWSLYVHDDAGGDVGSITGGWSLNIDAATPAPAKKKCKKHKKHAASIAKKHCKKKKH